MIKIYTLLLCFLLASIGWSNNTKFEFSEKYKELKDIKISAKVVTGKQLKVLDTFFNVEKKSHPSDKEMYLVMRLEKGKKFGKRIINLELELKSSEILDDIHLDFKFLAIINDIEYKVVKIIGKDDSLVKGTREKLLKADLVFTVKKVFLK